jgi:hypothetical protein
VIRFWAGCQLVHLSAGGARIKAVRAHLSVAGVAKLAATGAVPAGPPPLPPIGDGQAIVAGRPVSRGGLVWPGGRRVLAAEILSGQLAGIRLEPATLMFLAPATRILLRTRPSPLTTAQVARVRGARPARPPPRPPAGPIRVQRRASATGVIVACGQKIAPSRVHAGQTVSVAVPAPRWPSSLTAPKPASCAAPPARRSATSEPAGRGRSPQLARAGVSHHLAALIVTLVPCGAVQSLRLLSYDGRAQDRGRGRDRSCRLRSLGAPSAHALGRNR